jgi:hypothetical protein
MVAASSAATTLVLLRARRRKRMHDLTVLAGDRKCAPDHDRGIAG